MPPPVIEAGPVTLRPFNEADIVWVYEMSQDPAIQRSLAEVFAPYRMEHAAYFVRQLTLAGAPGTLPSPGPKGNFGSPRGAPKLPSGPQQMESRRSPGPRHRRRSPARDQPHPTGNSDLDLQYRDIA
jgi:hypothetical protein